MSARVAVVASAPGCCTVCGSREVVQLLAMPPLGVVFDPPKFIRCPHCRPNGLPYFPLPTRVDQPRSA